MTPFVLGILVVTVGLSIAVTGSLDPEGPVFTLEPPMRVDFANSTGARIDCAAHGSPPPSIRWIRSDSTPVGDVPGLRQMLSNGSLVFHPFRADAYLAEVHSVTYLCLASNPSGIITSRQVQVRAVVLQVYEVQVYDEYVINGNIAVMKCTIPSFVKDYVRVTSWVKETDSGYRAIEDDDRCLLMPTGELHILNVGPSDGSRAYRCRTVHRLTGETRLSATTPSGRLYVTESRGSVSPRVTDTKATIQALEGDKVYLPCAAQGFPIPTYSWYKKITDSETLPLTLSERIRQVSGSLIIESAQILDSGVYICEVANTMGSVRGETVLSVNDQYSSVFVSNVDHNGKGKESFRVRQGLTVGASLTIMKTSELTGFLKVPLSAYIYPPKQIVDLGQSASLSCVASGHPVNQITWFKDGKPLLTDTINQVSQEVLRIDHVSKIDRGMYQCFVTNYQEAAQGTAELRLGDTPPEFQRVFGDRTYQQGSFFSLYCTVSGNPTPVITWSLDGMKFPLDSSPRIHHNGFTDLNGDAVSFVNVSRADVQDGGEYKCSASNQVGYVEHVARINIQGPPHIRFKSSQVKVVAGTDLVVRCFVSGYPIDSISWERDQRTLPINHRQKVFPNGTLIIHNVQRNPDNGKYTCAARGLSATDRRDLEVIVMAPPKIIPFSFQDEHLREGLRARIQCVVSEGDLPIAITWLKDGRMLSPNDGITVRDLDDFSSMLTVSSVSSRHNGNYTCLVTNKAASINYTTVLSVNVPPKIIPFSFQDAQLHEGMRAQITCAISQGDRPIHLSWDKDGHSIPTNLQIVVRNFDEVTSSLSIESVSSRHSGNYTCTATNHAAEEKHTAHLVVNVPPRWVTQPQDSYVLLGNTIVLACRADGFPPPIVTWMKAIGDASGDYREITYSNSHLQVHEDGSLQIHKAKETDKGYYLCKANNGIGAGLSEVVHLNVHVPAYFQTKERNYTAKAGEDAVLHCEALGDEPLTVTWGQNKQRSRANSPDRYKEEPQERWGTGKAIELVIKTVERQDSGGYPCIAKNPFGQDEATINLIIQEKPESPFNVWTSETTSRSVQLDWSIPFDGNNGITTYIVQYKPILGGWSDDSRNVTVFGQSTVVRIDHLTPATRYTFRVYARNDVGTSPPSKEVEVLTDIEAPGGAPWDVRVEAVDSTTLTVFWKPPRRDLWYGKIEGYKVGFRLYGSDIKDYVYKAINLQDDEDMIPELHLSLTNLRKYTDYGIVVQAFNHKGSGPNSEEVSARSAEDVPSQAPENVRCTPLTSQSVAVSWDPPPTTAIHGTLSGYKTLYKPLTEWYDETPPEAQISQMRVITLMGLKKFQNYSIQVLAFTRVGDGIRSDPITCQTKEDVPEAPTSIKALVMSMDSILVVWTPPSRPNGHIIRYTVYMRNMDFVAEETTKRFISASVDNLSYEARSLKPNHRYEFWVTASTTLGEGHSTKPVPQTPSTRVPARIAAFDKKVVTRWRSNITLSCRSVGIPTPETEWRFKDVSVISSTKYNIHSNEKNLEILNVQTTDAGLYTCRVTNLHGSDTVLYTLAVQAPPSAPSFQIVSSSFTSLEIQWSPESDGGSPIEGYTIYYKRDFGEWEEVEVSGRSLSYFIDNLWCGTRYQVYVVARNKIGGGEPAEIQTYRTKGSAPEKPPKHKMANENATFVTLNLDTWENGGCPILYFVIEYKPQTQNEWMLVSNNVKVQTEKFTILDLQSGIKYNLRVTAHNSAGSTIAEYNFSTLSTVGADSADIQPNPNPFYLDVSVIFPIVIFLCLIILIMLAIYCWRKNREHHCRRNSETSLSQPKQYEARFVPCAERKPTIVQNDFDKGSFTCLLVNVEGGSADASANNTPRNVARGPREEIQPYATYQLPDCRTEGFTSEDWKRYEVYNPGHQTLRAVRDIRKINSSSVYPHLRKGTETECLHGQDSSLSDDQEYASPVRSSDTSDSTSGTNPNTEIEVTNEAVKQPPKPRKPGRRAKVPDLIYRRRQDCCSKTRPSAPELQSFPEDGGECSSTLENGHPMKIPRPQLERPTAPIPDGTIEASFNFLEKMGSSQESSDTARKSEDNEIQTSTNSTNSKDSST